MTVALARSREGTGGLGGRQGLVARGGELPVVHEDQDVLLAAGGGEQHPPPCQRRREEQEEEW